MCSKNWLIVLFFSGLTYATCVVYTTASFSPVSAIFSRGIVSPSNAELLHNSIGFGVPAFLCFLLRMVNRGWVLRKFHKEDYLMSITMIFYINLLVLINVSARYNTNLYPPEQEASILANPADVKNRIFGSRVVIGLEQSMMATTWGVKICIWTFLLRLVRMLPRFEFALWILFGYIVVSFFVIEIVYFGIVCRPFSQYWALPVTNPQCATYHTYSIVQMVFNISSDLGLIVIPSIMVYISHIPWKRKMVLIGIFSIAVLTIIAAIMNKYYNFASPETTTYQLWYIRESSIAVVVGNLICCWQLLQKLFKFRSFDNAHAGIRPEADIPRPAGLPHFNARRFGEFARWGINFTTRKSTANDSSFYTGETAVDDSGELRQCQHLPKRTYEKNPLTSYVMTLARDDEGDARDAIAYRERNDIV